MCAKICVPVLRPLPWPGTTCNIKLLILMPSSRFPSFLHVLATYFAFSDFHTAAIDEDGRLWTWGWGGSLFGGIGGLGHGDEAEQPRPKVVRSLVDYGCRVGSVACGEKHTLILTDDGEVLTAGNGEYGRLGNGGSSDHRVPEPVELFDEK